MSELPRDVLIDILSRLPAKSLGQFKSVCKYWFSLISSTDFVKLHHHQALFDTNTNHSRVFIMSTYSMHSVDYESPSCYEGIDDDAKAIVSLNDPLTKAAVGEKLLGSCYGLVYFICFNECILLWNPTTQATRLIQEPSTPIFDGTPFYGLGYDFSIDDYKMVRASHSVANKSIGSEVFNLKTGSWRTIQASHININNPDEIGIFSNGALHWLVSHDNGSKKHETILSFNMTEERFKEICLPNGSEPEKARVCCLSDLKGRLYAAFGDGGADLEVWVMTQYGVENSWSKVIELNWVGRYCDYYMSLVCFTQEDDIVIDLDSWDLVRYNASEKTIKKVKKRSTDWHSWLMYTETLVSPYG